jgi:hypothetical protein
MSKEVIPEVKHEWEPKEKVIEEQVKDILSMREIGWAKHK